MDNKMIYAIVVGIILFGIVMALRLLANQEGLSLILFYITFFIVGLVATGIKRGSILGFSLGLVLAIIQTAISQPEFFNNADFAMAQLLFSIVGALIASALGAIGGLIGKKTLK